MSDELVRVRKNLQRELADIERQPPRHPLDYTRAAVIRAAIRSFDLDLDVIARETR